MSETPRERWALLLGGLAVMFPAMAASGFVPALKGLPLAGWLVIGAVGAGVAGAVATPKWARGILAGALAGAGAVLCMWLYVVIRSGLTASNSFLKIEVVLPCLLGTVPGILLYNLWARQPPVKLKDERPLCRVCGFRYRVLAGSCPKCRRRRREQVW